MKELPIKIQNFKTLRTNNYLYVDKTQPIHELITSGHIYFLSRPRCFGKSLLISTIQELFKGNKKLFEGLYIHDKWDWSKKYPVLKLDFDDFDYKKDKDLEKFLTNFIDKKAKEFEISLTSSFLESRFAQLLKKLEKKSGQSVVLLIDDAYKPVSDSFPNHKQSEVNRKILSNFYQVIKACDGNLKFIFLASVFNFIGGYDFSSFNSPNDITGHYRYSTICGYTQEELETNFANFIDDTAKELNKPKPELLADINHWYGGHCWDGKIKVYNPISISNLFAKKQFGNYWTKAIGKLPANLFLQDDDQENLFEPIIVDDLFFAPNRYEGTTKFLFQTGYLTIKDASYIDKRMKYVLQIPNQEVKDALTKTIKGEKL